LFAAEDLNFMLRLRSAFNPDNRCSPGKLFPTAGGCAEPGSIPQTRAGRRAAV
jgi:glycolate oxidase